MEKPELANNKIGYYQAILPASEPLALTDISPNTKLAGDPDFNLVLNGTGFDVSSVALWNGIELVTSLVSDAQLTALVPSYYISVEGVAEIAVRNGPDGSTVTPPITFTIQPRINTWMSHSPEGGIVWDVAVDPTNSGIVYAATNYSGVYKSTNGGQNWLAINNGLTTSSLATIAVNPSNSSILFAGSSASGDGVFRSTNGGVFWTRILVSPNVHTIKFDPQNSNIAYAATGCGLFKTINGGTIWQEISGNKLPIAAYCQGAADILSLAIDPQNSGTLYVIVNQEGTVWKTANGGSTWQNVSDGLPGTMLRSIAIDPVNPNILYAGTEYKNGLTMGLYKSDDGGQSWVQVINNGHYYFDIDISKSDPNIISVIAGPQQGIYRSTDSGITWQFIPSSADLMNIDTDPNDFTTVYGVGYHGIFKSTNGGVNWEAINKGLYAQSITSLLYVPQNNNSIFATTVYGGNWKSTDFGASWQKWGNYKGDTFNELNFSKIVADPNNSMNMYANNYKSNDGGQIWEWFTPNIFSGSPVAAITIAANSDIYNGVNISWGESRIVKSTDGGNTWNNKSNGISARSIQFMEADPFDPNIIYAYFSDWYDGRDGGLLYKSIDAGENWGLIYSGVILNGWGIGLNALAIDPSNTSIIYLAATTGVLKSLDSGATWTSVSSGLSGIVVTAIAVDTDNNQILYIGTERNGVYKSLNAGLSWESLNYGLNSLMVRAVLPIPNIQPAALSSDIASSYAVAGQSQVVEQSQRLLSIAGSTVFSYYNYIETFIISGNVGAAGVTLSYSDGTAKTVNSLANGSFSFQVSNNWSGTVTPTHPCFTFSPAIISYSKVTANLTAQNYTATINPVVSCANINVDIGGINRGIYGIPTQGSIRQNYASIDSGPVKVESTNSVPIVSAIREAWAVNGVTTSFFQMMGLPQEQLSDTYVFPGYNNVTLNEQLRISNVDSVSSTVTVTIGGVVRGTYPLAAGEAVRVNYAGLDSGPVVVQGTTGVKIISAIREAWAVNGVTKSFVQLMGLPKQQLSDQYVFPGYNNVTLNEQLRIGNVDTVESTVTVTIGGVLRGTYILQPNEAVRVNYAGVDSGPVIVQGTTGVKIISAIREAWAVNGVTTSFAQLMGLPSGQLSNKYVFPGYNNVTLNDQLRIGNVDSVATTVTVKIGGVLRGTYTLQPNEAVRVNYAGVDSGPVVVEGTTGVKIISAIREAWAVNGVTQSFVQLMGLPSGQLSNKYVFPGYNNVTLNDQLRIGNVDSVATTVAVMIGGVLRGTYTLQPNEAVRVNYAGVDSGPVVVEGTTGVNIISAIREAWAVNGVTTSFVQLMGLPSGQLSSTFWFPAYNNVTLNEQLRIAVP
jgi:photosystem II stability/assembly factor-like uncharacterized protein